MEIYKIDLDYIRFLHYKYDSRVQYNENQLDNYNSNRPYIGILLTINNMLNYFAPLEHPRPAHIGLKSNPHIIKIDFGKLGLIALNNMIPVHNSMLINFDINNDPNKKVLLKQYQFCDDNRKHIMELANKVYQKRITNPNDFENKIYCDFKNLEQGLIQYCFDNKII